MPTENFVKQEWTSRILTSFRRAYPDGEFPQELLIIGNGFDGFGSPGLVAVSQGVVAEANSGVRLFALSHETGHCVSGMQCESLGIQPFQPIGIDAKRHEMMADLIAVFVLKTYLPTISQHVFNSLSDIENRLGAKDNMHPSGQDRVKLMCKFFQGASFSVLFKALALRIPINL